MRPFLSNKNTVFSQSSTEKNPRIISDDSDLSQEFSTLFEDAVGLLSVKPDEYYLSDKENLSDPTETAIKKFENQSSVQAIKQNISANQDFYFSNTEVRDILKETTALNNKKNGNSGNIPTKSGIPTLNDIWNKEIIRQKSFKHEQVQVNIWIDLGNLWESSDIKLL